MSAAMAEQEMAICDLRHLHRLLSDYLDAYEGGILEDAEQCFQKVTKQVKGVATLYLDYNREVLDGYSNYLKRQGFKVQLIPVKGDETN